MAEEAVVDADTGLVQSPLVSVSFQRNEQRKLKFLEGEPKALGITQICLTLFYMSCLTIFPATGLERHSLVPLYYIPSLFVIIAGCVTIAARNLHRPTLKACLGMEVFASIAALINIIFSQGHMFYVLILGHACSSRDECIPVENAHLHLCAEFLLIHVALFAISVTLVVYACKVINCCSPASKVPVITIQATPAPQ